LFKDSSVAFCLQQLMAGMPVASAIGSLFQDWPKAVEKPTELLCYKKRDRIGVGRGIKIQIVVLSLSTMEISQWQLRSTGTTTVTADKAASKRRGSLPKPMQRLSNRLILER
jgi:hypothetical protein